MANILVTGGAGYVGSVCSAELLAQGHSVTIVDDLPTGFRDSVPAGAAFFQMDLGDRAGMQSLVQHIKFDAVFHFAAKALVGESMVNPGFFFEQNVARGITMLEVLRAANIRNFVFSSSAAVYGISARMPMEEDDSKKPINSYGESKLVFEQILQWYARAYDWTVFAFRYFNAAGATKVHGEKHDPETHAIPLLLQAASGERASFSIYGDDHPTPDGTCILDYVHVLYIPLPHFAALKRMNQPGMRAYTIGLGNPCSVRQLWQVGEKAVGHAVLVRISPRRDGDPPSLCASPRRIMADMGWKPEHDLEDIVASAWKWKQAHPNTQAACPRSG